MKTLFKSILISISILVSSCSSTHQVGQTKESFKAQKLQKKRTYTFNPD